MDFHALPRRDLQALCKRNAIRANMSNAAMADALGSLQSVEGKGIDKIRTAAAPGMSAAKSAAEDVVVKEQRNGCPLPRGGRSRATTRTATAVAHKIEEAALAPDCPLRSQEDTAARDAPTPVDAEAVPTGKRRTRRSMRSKANVVSDQKEGAAATALTEPIEPKLFEKNSVVGEEKLNGCQLPRGGRGRTTRSRATAHKTEDAMLSPGAFECTQKMVTQEGAVSVEVEEASTGKRRRKRSRRSKMRVALDKKEEVAVAHMKPVADSSNAATGPEVILEKNCDDPKEEAKVDEEITKPQEGQMHNQNPSTYSGKRRTRRSRRAKVKMALDKKEEVAAAVRKDLIADSSDGITGSTVVSDKSCDDCKEEKVSVVEVGATIFQEGVVEELEPDSAVEKSPSSSLTMKDTPIQCILSTAESRGPVIEKAQDASVRCGGSFAESDGFSLTNEVDQSNLLVNTLDRFVKPMCKFAVKEEKQEGECWWMLM